MTAVSVQQHGTHRQQYNPRQSPHSSNGPSPGSSRPQSYTPSAQRQESPTPVHMNGNGPAGIINHRPSINNDPVEYVNTDGTSDIERRPTPSASQHTIAVRDRRRASLSSRPSSASKADSSQDESEVDKPRQRSKHVLLRSKSDYGPRGEERDSQVEEIQDWGARHGFEGHYASEEYVSQLANVSFTFLLLSKPFSWTATQPFARMQC